MLKDGEVRVFADPLNRKHLGQAKTLEEVVAAHVSQIHPGDYLAINAYVERTPAVHEVFQRIRVAVRDAKHVATTLGYGPRFLHSTGQLHKGGPNSGVFIQVTSDDADDLAIPGEPYSFGVLKAAQALGDMQALTQRNRRVIRVHLGADVQAGLKQFQKAVEGALVAQRV